MKYKVRFTHQLTDGANPKRFARAVNVDVNLEFPLPKQTSELILKLKTLHPQMYAKLKLEQFETYTGVDPEKFQAAFNANIKKKIDANFADYVKNVAKPDFSPAQWDKVLNFFEGRQVELVKAAFAKGLAEITQVNYEKLEKLRAAAPKPDEVRKLDVDQAFLLWNGRKAVKFSKVEDKFYGDHFQKDVSQASAFDLAIERYKKKKSVTTSSVAKVAPSDLLNKANSGQAYPAVFNGSQQIAVKVTCEVISVSLETVTVTGEKNLKTFKADNKHHHHVGNDQWIKPTFTKGQQTFYVMGDWDPETGKAVLYHYQNESGKPAAKMLPEYLTWTYSHKEGKFTGPTG
ncbi:MAG: hypothetical protein ACT6S0_06460 [Roseateles sp.]|uniref:hypothetical protein n=1 Tax=Roseateles sp. TaxID=1971397 RepID=UPI0040354D53